MALDIYRRKRDFHRTPEPRGAAGKSPGTSFVIHKHAARRLHYDLRLQYGGVLVSWAVPKGPSLDPGERRLAVKVEDHPLDYGAFEGNIPKGEYGAGAVIIWDRGRWIPEGDPAAGLRKGHLRFRLQGKKLAGGWSLVRMGKTAKAGKENWLLIKSRDRSTKAIDILADQPESAVSGKTIEEIRAGAQAKIPNSKLQIVDSHAAARAARAKIGKSKIQNSPAGKLPAFIDMQLATLADQVPGGDDWLHEVKLDGYRMLCRIDKGKVRFFTRHGLDWTGRVSSLAQAAASLPCRRALLDGEVVVLDDSGVSDFGALQDALSRHDTSRLIYFAFDLLHLDGADLTGMPLTERKQRLSAVLEPDGNADRAIRYCLDVLGQGDRLLAKACELGVEGIVSKRADGLYRPGRSRDWLKIKCLRRQEFVIAGFTDPAGSRGGFGALLLSYYGADKKLLYAGKVGTGFSADALNQLRRRMERLEQKDSPLAVLPARAERRGAHWVKPVLVAEVAFTGWTRDSRLRHPAFVGLREDKAADEIFREEPDSTAVLIAQPNGIADGDEDKIAGIRLTHPERVLYPEQGITKRELARYYATIADVILPHLQDRPLTLVRCPESYDQECFYQRHANDVLDDSVRRVRIEGKRRGRDYIAVDSPKGLIALVQAGVLELHTWGARRDRLDRPDRLTFDLDPDPSLPWSAVAEAALQLRARLAAFGLGAFVKSTGGKGLHVVVPIARTVGWDETKAFAKALAEAMVADEPKKYLAVMSKARRPGKIFIDYLRNGWAATAVAAFSTRARAGAPVSAPLFWHELDSCRGDTFNLKNIGARLAQLKSDPWADYEAARRPLTAALRKKIAA
jgi:bifunctional non-homologous end joining protein LigD